MQRHLNISPRNKLILTIASIVITVFIVAVGTILILKTVAPRHRVVATQAVIKSKTVSDIISAYTKPGAIPSLSQALYISSENTLNKLTINYQASDHNYAVSVPASDSMLFSAKKVNPVDDSAKVQSDTVLFMKQQGLAQVTSIPDALLPSQKYTTFSGNGVICQLIDTPNTSSLTHQLSCADTKAINTEYERIDGLLDIYKKNGGTLADFTRATSYTNKSGSVSYILLTLSGGNRILNSLLFGVVDNNQQYIGDVTSGDEKYSNGKYIITPATLKAMSDSKYNGFLLKNFTGQATAPVSTK